MSTGHCACISVYMCDCTLLRACVNARLHRACIDAARMRECAPPPAGSGPLPTLLLRRLCVAKSAALSRLRQELIPAAIEFERPPAVGTGRSPSRYPPDSLSRARSPKQVPEWGLTKLLRGASLKMECHSKWNVTQNGMLLKMECHSK